MSVHGSPIADSLPFLLVADAELELVGRAGRRRVKLNNFYRGYKVKDLAPDEIITHIRIPRLGAGDVLKLYKVLRPMIWISPRSAPPFASARPATSSPAPASLIPA